MSERDHVKVVHIFIRNKNTFSLFLVGNGVILPVWDLGISLTTLATVKLDCQANGVRALLMDYTNRICLPKSSDNIDRVWDTGWQ